MLQMHVLRPFCFNSPVPARGIKVPFTSFMRVPSDGLLRASRVTQVAPGLRHGLSIPDAMVRMYFYVLTAKSGAPLL